MEGELELLGRYRRAQDAEAFRALVEGHQDMVFAACHRILGNHADAEDAAQDCFFRLARFAEKLKPPIAGWLHTVAVRVALDLLRKRKSMKARHEAARREARRPPPPDPTWGELKGAVDTAIAGLPERLRVPLVLYYLEQRTQEEIGAELGISQPAVSQRLKRAVGALRRRLKRKGFTSLDMCLAPLLTGQALEAAPASLTAALGKMAVAGVAPGGAAAGTGSGTVTVAGGLSAGKAAGLVVAAAAAIAALALLVHLASPTAASARRVARQPAAPAEVPQPPPESPKPPPASQIAAAGPVTLNPQGKGTRMFLDLDTGRLYDLPEGMATPEAMVAWMRRTGADVLYAASVSGPELLAVDLRSQAVGGRGRDAQATTFYRQAAAAPPQRTLSRLGLNAGSPVTYAYRTREGGEGMLEVRRVSEASGMELLYQPRTVP